jgi:hypothetical protein
MTRTGVFALVLLVLAVAADWIATFWYRRVELPVDRLVGLHVVFLTCIALLGTATVRGFMGKGRVWAASTVLALLGFMGLCVLQSVRLGSNYDAPYAVWAAHGFIVIASLLVLCSLAFGKRNAVSEVD